MRDICKRASKSPFWSLLLFKLIREFKPVTCLELGTCLGISASYQAAALKLNGAGKIVTMEGAETLARALDLDNTYVVVGRFQDTLHETLKTHAPIDYAFIDGHDEKATLTYLDCIAPFLSSKSNLVFDDISWSEGMKRAWKAIVADERINISPDLGQMGICVVNRTGQRKEAYRAPLI